MPKTDNSESEKQKGQTNIIIVVKGAAQGSNYSLYSYNQPQPIAVGNAPDSSFKISIPDTYIGPGKLKVTIPFRTRDTYPISFSREVLISDGVTINLAEEQVPSPSVDSHSSSMGTDKKLLTNTLKKKVQEAKTDVVSETVPEEEIPITRSKKRLLGNKLQEQVQEAKNVPSIVHDANEESDKKTFWDRFK